MSRQNQPPFAIGDEVVFIKDPAPAREYVVSIKWITRRQIWRAETAWRAETWQVETHSFAPEREYRRTVNAARLVGIYDAPIAPLFFRRNKRISEFNGDYLKQLRHLKQLQIDVVDLANENLGKLDGTTAPIRKIIDDHDVVYSVWQDLHKPDSIDVLLIKGSQALREVIASGSTARVKISAIPCECYEQAIAGGRHHLDPSEQEADARLKLHPSPQQNSRSPQRMRFQHALSGS